MHNRNRRFRAVPTLGRADAERRTWFKESWPDESAPLRLLAAWALFDAYCNLDYNRDRCCKEFQG